MSDPQLDAISASDSTGRTITKQTVIVRLKSIHRDRMGPGHFFYESSVIICNTVGCFFILLFLSIFPIIMIYYGVVFISDCPAQRMIPIYLVVSGVFGLAAVIFFMSRKLFPDSCLKYVVYNKCFLIGVFIVTFVWFILGNVWVFEVYWPSQDCVFQPTCCNHRLYVAAIFFIIASHAIIITILLSMAALYYLTHLDLIEEAQIKSQMLSPGIHEIDT